jgi:hypothetical protein
MTALPLNLGSPPVRRVADPLDRYYTFPHVAEAFVSALPWQAHEVTGLLVEPSVGAGAWLSPLAQRYPAADLVGVDIDPRAAGLHSNLLAHAWAEDWRQAVARLAPLGRVDLVAGNPPFSLLDESLEAALSCSRRVAFLIQDNAMTAEVRADLIGGTPLRAVLASSTRLRWVGRSGQSSFTHSVYCWEAGWSGPCSYRRVDTSGAGRGDLLARDRLEQP